MIVALTRDSDFLRRWMLRPSFVKKMGGFPAGVDADAAFSAMLASDARFFGVWDGAAELGCIIFRRIAEGWELHLCLATWWSKTRMALVAALAALSETGGRVIARYDAMRRSIDLLLDDVGFSEGVTCAGWRTRELTL